MSYDIRQDFIPGLPKTPYRNGIGKYEGVCMHDTACMNDSDESQTVYFKREWKNRSAFVHAFCDHDSITQNADWNYKSWGCGNGNSRFINIELCNTKDTVKFEAGFNRWCWLAAKKLFERKLGVTDGVTLVSHDWVSKHLGGTNHSDPHDYLALHGKKWSDVVAKVKAFYSEMEKGNMITPKPAPKPVATSNVGKLVVVLVDKLNVHKSADLHASSVCGVVKKGEAFTIKAEHKDVFELKSGLFITKSTKYVKVK